MSEMFDIYSKIFFRDVVNFFRHLCELVLRHQMRVSNYFFNSFYSAWIDWSFLVSRIFFVWVLKTKVGVWLSVNPPVEETVNSMEKKAWVFSLIDVKEIHLCCYYVQQNGPTPA